MQDAEGHGRRRTLWGKNKMSEGAGSGCGRESVPPSPGAAKELEVKRWGSAQPLAQSTRRVLLLVQISMGLLD